MSLNALVFLYLFIPLLAYVYSTEDEEFRDMSNKATSMLRAFLRTAPDCLSLEDYARAWDECARTVVSEHAQRAGGGCFSSRYGTWEDFVAAT